MRVKLVYRNYKPLHKIYQSLIDNPPKNIEYSFEKPIVKLGGLHALYRKYRSFSIVQRLRRIGENFIFDKSNDINVDIYHYINMFPKKPIETPYIVEFEHATGLIGFNNNKNDVSLLKTILVSKKCKSIIATSDAALKSLKMLTGEGYYKKITGKCNVVMPTLPAQDISSYDKEFMKNDKLNILFVGNDARRKGLSETLYALKELEEEYHDKFHLHIISNDGQKIRGYASAEWVSFYLPKFTQKEIMRKFYIPSDLFILPTKQDTYGMAIIDSLASGTPVVCTNQFALKEIVEDNLNGILLKDGKNILNKKLFLDDNDRARVNSEILEKKMVLEIKAVMSSIFEKPEMINSMKLEAQNNFKKGGKLYYKDRNNKLISIYSKAMDE